MAYRLISADQLLTRAPAAGAAADPATTDEQRAFQSGFDRANARFATVMASAAARANPAAAVFMLTETGAPAETIIGKLANVGSASATHAAGASARADTDKLWDEVQGRPSQASDSGTRPHAGAAADRGGGTDAEALWAGIQGDGAPTTGNC